MWIVIISMVFIAAIFFSVAIILHISDKKRKKICTEQVSATVIENKKNLSDYSVSYTPVFRYEYKMKVYITQASFSSVSPEFSKGETMKIFIDPSSPHKIYVPQTKINLILEIIFMLIGVIILAVMVFIIMEYEMMYE